MSIPNFRQRPTKLGYVLILLCLLALNLAPNFSVVARGESVHDDLQTGLQVGAKDALREQAAQPDMSGDWVGTDQTTSGQTFSFTLNVIQSDNQLIGTCVWSDGPTCTITGTVNGLSVIWTRTDVGSSYQAYFSGTLSSDYQTMSGTWSDTNGASGNWQAVKQGQSIHIVSDSTVKYSETEISGWQATTFDDSTWPNVVAPSIGLCPLTTGGGGRIPGSLALPVWRPNPDQYQTIYARKTFTVQNPTSAIMKTLIDDDFDLYVNGVLVLSNWDNQASYIDVDISAFLQSGVNSIAFKASDTVGGCQSLAFDVTVVGEAKLPVIDYFALGDSIASGHGLNDDGTACHRSDRSYPNQVIKLLEKRYERVNSIIFACSGATTHIPSTKTLEQSPYKWFPSQVLQVISYINTHPSDDPILVSITIGANDFEWTNMNKYADKMFYTNPTNFQKWLDEVVLSKNGVKEVVRKQVNILLNQPNVTVILTEIHNPMNPKSFFFINTTLRGCRTFEACYKRTEDATDELNTALKDLASDIAQPTRLQVALVEESFHDLASPLAFCGLAGPSIDDTYIQYPGNLEFNSFDAFPLWIRVLFPQGHGGDCFHPNDKGAAAYADAVNDAALIVDR